jgi:uncharacterized protein YdeI (YjbR/CyaY-like superfamily)
MMLNKVKKVIFGLLVMNVADEDFIHPTNQSQLRKWLLQNHARQSGTWLVTYKMSSGKQRIDYKDIVDELLCFGWIDSKPNAIDDEKSKLWIAPRKLNSGWSKVNKEKIERLINLKKMHQSGLTKIEEAKKNGSWTKLDQVEELEIPVDLEKEFKKYKSAASYFEAFPKSVKRSILEWIHNAKKIETREKRIKETAQLAESNLRANQWHK